MIEHVAVDATGCIGAGQCALNAPEVLDVHDGVAHVVDATPGAHLHDGVLDAADACPVQAVLLRLSTPPA